MPFSFTILPRKFGFSYFPFIQSLSVLRNQEESHSKVALAAPVKAYKQEKKLYVKRCSDESAISWPLDQQGCDSDGSRKDQVCCGLGSAKEGESRQQW